METHFYKIVRDREIGIVRCGVIEDDRPRRLVHIVLHSPTGLETGYGGSGPADLAASILADFLGVEASKVRREWSALFHHGELHASAMLVIRLHQSFKREFVEPHKIEPGESYIIAGDCVERWIAAQSVACGTLIDREKARR